ncbi:hypothetical protein LTR37_001560 [Vermiconidia calcicola]|uniref:Uncharacterized protein n=1 Tax=Vermiconidia calcicola TaxID=1690605 RepID=A0ACC3NWZ3_9PEZI|nr:hypothetical protein LTR37_001560 [Vermiconidia calcicola]
MSSINYSGCNAEYVPQLRHASSAGGFNTNDEPWTILSWYGTIHKLSIEERTTVGIGMSQSQKSMWLKVSKAAYDSAVFPESYFDADHMIIADVDNFDLWFLLHEITRKTYRFQLSMSVKVSWANVEEGEGCTKWNLLFSYSDGSQAVAYCHWRGNTSFQAKTQLAERILADMNKMAKLAEDLALAHAQKLNVFPYPPATATDNADDAKKHSDNLEFIAAALKQEAKDLDKREDAIKKREVELMVQQKHLGAAAGSYQHVPGYYDRRTGLRVSDAFDAPSATAPLSATHHGLPNPLYVDQDLPPTDDMRHLARTPAPVISGQCVQITNDTDSQAKKPTGLWTLSPGEMTQLQAKKGKSTAAPQSTSQTPVHVAEHGCVQIESKTAGDNSYCGASKVYLKAKALSEAFDEEIAATSLQKSAAGMPVSDWFDRSPPTSDIRNSSAPEPGAYWAKMKANKAKEASKVVEDKATAIRQPSHAAQFG